MKSMAEVNEQLNRVGVAINGRNPCDVQVHDERLFKDALFHGSLGVGEAYVKGWWDCDQLDDLFCRLCRHRLDEGVNPVWLRFFTQLKHVCQNLQSRMRAEQVADVHYNIGNDLYEKMLGETMAYTCGYWRTAKNLDDAQRHKFDLVCKKLGLKAGEKVLELGCGWGSFAKYAAEKYGCSVVAVNISKEQVAYARTICKGLPVEAHLCDYRDEHVYNPRGILFDKVSSIGLCEHVGHKNYTAFLQLVRKNLKDDGLFLLHTIGKNQTSTFSDPWITKYIFPNGMLPSVKQLAEASEEFFIIEDLHNFGADYDKTLMAWHRNFVENWEPFREKYGDAFYRKWTYYLLTCAGAFRARSMQLWQFVLSPSGVDDGYRRPLL